MRRRLIPADVERRVRTDSLNRCGYCLSPQHLVMVRLQIEHIIPLAKGGTSSAANLWLSCPLCNGHKSDKTEGIDPATGERVALFNPRTQWWSAHFEWLDGGLRIGGKTPVGRATAVALHLGDDPTAIQVRAYWILAGWHPPKD